jgi:hypothetical protein
MPCPFANILGEAGKGIHAKSIFGMPQDDWLMPITGLY